MHSRDRQSEVSGGTDGGKAGEVWLLGLVMRLRFIPEDPPSLFVTPVDVKMTASSALLQTQGEWLLR